MPIKTQGTEIYIIDEGSVLDLGCVQSIDGISGEREDIVVECLNKEEKQHLGGQMDPGEVTFNIALEPDNETHQTLHELYRDGTDNVRFAIGFGDGTADPAVVSDEFDFSSTGRSFVSFKGYINDFPMTAEIDDVWMSELSIQMSSIAKIHAKSDNGSEAGNGGGT